MTNSIRYENAVQTVAADWTAQKEDDFELLKDQNHLPAYSPTRQTAIASGDHARYPLEVQPWVALFQHPSAANTIRYLNWRRDNWTLAQRYHGEHIGDGVCLTAAGREYEPLTVGVMI